MLENTYMVHSNVIQIVLGDAPHSPEIPLASGGTVIFTSTWCSKRLNFNFKAALLHEVTGIGNSIPKLLLNFGNFSFPLKILDLSQSMQGVGRVAEHACPIPLHASIGRLDQEHAASEERAANCDRPNGSAIRGAFM
jgi:hypothetical protein